MKGFFSSVTPLDRNSMNPTNNPSYQKKPDYKNYIRAGARKKIDCKELPVGSLDRNSLNKNSYKKGEQLFASSSPSSSISISFGGAGKTNFNLEGASTSDVVMEFNLTIGNESRRFEINCGKSKSTLRKTCNDFLQFFNQVEKSLVEIPDRILTQLKEPKKSQRRETDGRVELTFEHMPFVKNPEKFLQKTGAANNKDTPFSPMFDWIGKQCLSRLIKEIDFSKSGLAQDKGRVLSKKTALESGINSDMKLLEEYEKSVSDTLSTMDQLYSLFCDYIVGGVQKVANDVTRDNINDYSMEKFESSFLKLGMEKVSELSRIATESEALLSSVDRTKIDALDFTEKQTNYIKKQKELLSAIETLVSFFEKMDPFSKVDVDQTLKDIIAIHSELKDHKNLYRVRNTVKNRCSGIIDKQNAKLDQNKKILNAFEFVVPEEAFLSSEIDEHENILSEYLKEKGRVLDKLEIFQMHCRQLLEKQSLAKEKLGKYKTSINNFSGSNEMSSLDGMLVQMKGLKEKVYDSIKDFGDQFKVIKKNKEKLHSLEEHCLDIDSQLGWHSNVKDFFSKPSKPSDILFSKKDMSCLEMARKTPAIDLSPPSFGSQVDKMESNVASASRLLELYESMQSKMRSFLGEIEKQTDFNNSISSQMDQKMAEITSVMKQVCENYVQMEDYAEELDNKRNQLFDIDSSSAKSLECEGEQLKKLVEFGYVDSEKYDRLFIEMVKVPSSIKTFRRKINHLSVIQNPKRSNTELSSGDESNESTKGSNEKRKRVSKKVMPRNKCSVLSKVDSSCLMKVKNLRSKNETVTSEGQPHPLKRNNYV